MAQSNDGTMYFVQVRFIVLSGYDLAATSMPNEIGITFTMQLGPIAKRAVRVVPC